MPHSRIQKRRKHGHVVLLASLLSTFATMAGCAGRTNDTETAVPVEIVQVENATLQEKVAADAVLFPVEQSAIVPKLTAPVEKFFVNRGSHVRKGQLLAVLENRDLFAAAQENKGAYKQAQAAYEITTAGDLPQELQKAGLDVEAAKQTLNAQRKVFNSRQELFRQGALPRKELDQAGVDLITARNQYEIANKHLQALNELGKQQTLKSAKGQLESAQGKFQGAEAQLSYSEIRSPIDGVVTDRPLYPGEMAAAGTPLLTVMNLSQVVARAHISQLQAALLRDGDKAEIRLPGLDKSLLGKVVLVSPAIDPNSTTVEVWVQLGNSQGRLRPGTNVQVAMIARDLPEALVIPAAALLTAPDGRTSVMLAGDDGKAHLRPVKTGIRDGDRVQILDGLRSGQKIVGSGAYGLPDERKITTAGGAAEGKTNAPNGGIV